MTPLQHTFYDRPTEIVARELIGRNLVHMGEEGPIGGVIVETEAYGPDDPANHAFGGVTARNRQMFGPPGFAYVYRIYGVHWCLNAVTGAEGVGEAVLIRALLPTVGVAVMRSNRALEDEKRLCRGPGALCAALGIGSWANGADLAGPRLMLSEERVDGLEVVAVPRIGITRAADRLWRFAVPGSPYVSGPKRLISQEGR